MKNIVIIIMLCFGLASMSAKANGTWDGGGDGINWTDPLNWGDDIVPGTSDFVDIPSSTTVEINGIAVARNLDIAGGATLRILGTGSLTIDNSSGDALDINNNASLLNFGTLTITDAGTDGIDLNDGATLRNNGTINIGDGSNDDVEDGIDVSGSPVFVNRGSIIIRGCDSEGIDINGPMRLFNTFGAIIRITNTDNEGIYFDNSNSYLDNDGEITCIDNRDENIEFDGGSSINRSHGVISVTDGDLDMFELDGDMINDGVIRIFPGTASATNGDPFDLGSGDEFINNCLFEITGPQNGSGYCDVFGTFTNASLVNIAPTSGTDEALRIFGQFINSSCAALNIAGTQEIEVFGGDIFINDGIVTSLRTSDHNNSGTFTNNGELRSPGSSFSSSPNAIAGAGTIVAGPIPATEPLSATCAAFSSHITQIPTMSEWGLIAFGLLLASLVSVSLLRRRKRVLSS